MDSLIDTKNKDTHSRVNTVHPKKMRDSNLELFRILTMLLIVAHHYVVNSGLLSPESPLLENPMSIDSLFLMVLGSWGKIGINCFVMITGYFMCKSTISMNKFVKLFFEIMFYRIVIGVVFMISGVQEFSWIDFAKLFIPITQIADNFTGCYLVFFLFIPFLNILIRNLNEKQHIYLLLLCFLTYVMFGTLKGGPFKVVMNYVSWFSVLYIIASYIMLYPKKWFADNRICGIGLIITVGLSVLSVVICAYVGEKFDLFMPYYFVTDSNTVLAVLVGVFAFLFFKNLKMSYNKLINTIAASTFGVLLIHANSDTMRQWLWKDTLNNVGHYGLFLYPIISVLAIFAVCVIIDFIVKNTVEKVFFKFWDSYSERITNWWKTKEEAILWIN